MNTNVQMVLLFIQMLKLLKIRIVIIYYYFYDIFAWFQNNYKLLNKM